MTESEAMEPQYSLADQFKRFERRLIAVERDLAVLRWMVFCNLVVSWAILLKVFA